VKPDLKQLIEQHYFKANRQPFFEQLLNPILAALSVGSSTITMTVGNGHLNVQNRIHGGVLATLADLAMGVACITYGKQVVTSEMHLSYIAGAGEGGTLSAVATVLHNGKTLLRTTCAISDETGKLLVFANATYFVIGILTLGDELVPGSV
jgi:uncharacterized protein (TIGR00369 family)